MITQNLVFETMSEAVEMAALKLSMAYHKANPDHNIMVWTPSDRYAATYLAHYRWMPKTTWKSDNRFVQFEQGNYIHMTSIHGPTLGCNGRSLYVAIRGEQYRERQALEYIKHSVLTRTHRDNIITFCSDEPLDLSLLTIQTP